MASGSDGYVAITTGTRSAKRQVEESGTACEDGRILRKGFHAEDDDRGVGKRGVGNKTDVAGLWESTVDDRGGHHDPEGISICRHWPCPFAASMSKRVEKKAKRVLDTADRLSERPKWGPRRTQKRNRWPEGGQLQQYSVLRTT